LIPASIPALIDKIHIVPDENALHAVFEYLKPGVAGKPVRVAFINAHGFNLCWNDPEFLSNVLECDYVFRDGAGMKILYRLLGRDAGMNLNGTDLIPKIMDLYKGHDVALIGTDSPYLESAATKIAEKGLFPVITKNGFHETQSYIGAIKETPAPLIILAMGMPKQEYVAARMAETMHFSTLIVCGGAILDFISGKVNRAPEILRCTGFEWVYRLWQEPRRLFRRYIFGNLKFLWRAFQLARAPRKRSGNKIKVLHVVRQYAPSIGGLESYVQNLAQRQISMGYDCEVLTLNKIFHGGAESLPACETIDGVTIHRVPFLGMRRYFIPLVSPGFFKKYDVVHVHNTDMFYDYVGLCCFIMNVPAFATTHGGFFHTQDFSLIKKIYFQIITRFSSLFYKTIFAISRNDEENFQKITGKIVYLPNAIEPLGTEICSGEDFLFIGRLAQNKDVPRLIEVFSHVKKTHNVAGNLHIIGPEWDVSLDELRKIAADHNVQDFVIFHGASEFSNMQNIARSCGYFISASAYEGFGMSMLEGMSVGLVPLVHNNDAFRQLVTESGVGLLVDFNDPAIAAAAIAGFLPTVTMADRAKAQQFSAGFSWPELAEKVCSYYKRHIA